MTPKTLIPLGSAPNVLIQAIPSMTMSLFSKLIPLTLGRDYTNGSSVLKRKKNAHDKKLVYLSHKVLTEVQSKEGTTGTEVRCLVTIDR